jgi:uncharacterized damage-inducible protein DinB
MKNDLLDLIRYNDWANERMMEAIRSVSEESRRAPITSSFGSLRETLGHMVSAEWIWLQRWNGQSPATAPGWVASDSTDRFIERLAEIRKQRLAWLWELDEAAFEKTVDYSNLAGNTYRNSLADLIRHVVNHSTYHRGQLATQLRQLGQVPPSTDFIVYRREQSA